MSAPRPIARRTPGDDGRYAPPLTVTGRLMTRGDASAVWCALLVLASSWLYTGCSAGANGGNNGDVTADTGTLRMVFHLPDAAADAEAAARLIPQATATIRVTVSAADISLPLSQEVALADATGDTADLVFEIQVGQDRLVMVQALSALDAVLASAQTTVEILPAQETQAAMTLVPASSVFPVPAGTTTPSTAKVADVVTFGGSATDSDGTVANYEWDFDGDGTYDFASAAGPATTHSYMLEGTYTATLRVTDNDGLQTTLTLSMPVAKRPGGVMRVDYVGINSATPLSTFNMPICSSPDGSRIFIIYNTPDQKVRVAESPAVPGGTWETQVLAEGVVVEAAAYHDGPTITVDADGYIHAFYGMHNSPWGYSVSVAPNTIASGFVTKASVDWEDADGLFPTSDSGFSTYPDGRLPGHYITYPRAYLDSDGRLYLAYRDRDTDWLRNGDPRTPEGFGCFAVYDTATRTWEARQLFRDRNYVVGVHGFAFGGGGGASPRIHTCTTWRNQPAGGSESGTDLTYAYSDDLGETWHRTDGSTYTLPIAHDTGSPDIIVSLADVPTLIKQAVLNPLMANDNDLYLFFQRDSGGGVTYMKHLAAGAWDAGLASWAQYYQGTAISSDNLLMVPSTGSRWTSTNGGSSWVWTSRTTGLTGLSTVYLDLDGARLHGRRYYAAFSQVKTAGDGTQYSDVYFVVEQP